ncbi:WD40 repeat-like protein [Cystobasidium minutum MCA 4210]|uniref:WD40 repeat-like protein n=1 Tax=Cystobasidium minutum MCA 4210 TaxID=1397322 RepID=UPI0034CE46FB|eukprot:jgi/Rhomi1/3645/CE3644_4402
MPPVERLQGREHARESRDRAQDYSQALQPITTSQSTKILKDLAPQLLHPRILSSPAFLNGPSSSSTAASSSSARKSTASDLLNLSNPRNAFIALARLSGVSSNTNTLNLISKSSSSTSNNAIVLRGASASRKQPKIITSTDLRIIEDVDRLLNLPIPSTSSSHAVSRSGHLPTLQEEDAEEAEGEDEDRVDLLSGFNATIPSSRGRKLQRRKRRAILSEKQLGITIGVNELGLKERAAAIASTSSGTDSSSRRLSSLASDNGQYMIESIESTPKKRVIKSKRRSSFMPTPLRDSSRHSSLHNTDPGLAQSTIAEEDGGAAASAPPGRKAGNDAEEWEEELLTKPELESEIKEIKLDKEALDVRRKLTMKDLSILEEKIRKLEVLKEELGQRLLELKEEELELDDELEGVQDRLTQLEARQAGRVVSSTSSRRRKGPAFLPSEHDALPPNVAFMTLTSRNPAIQSCSVTSLDFSEPYGLLVASYSLPSTSAYTSSSSASNNYAPGGGRNGQVSVYDLTDGEELARLEGHSGIVKALLVEGDMAISGGEDGKIALWDLTKAIEDGLPEEDVRARDNDDDETTATSGGRGSKNNYVGAGTRLEDEEDVFFSSRPSSVSGRRRGNGVNGTASHHSDNDDDDDFPPLPSPKPMNAPLSSTSTAYNDEPTPSAARLRLLEGHSKAVTCLSYENTSLVSGSSDKTLRLWDLNTGQCVVTMDILWAISNPLPVDADIEEQTASVQPTSASGSVKADMSQSMGNLPTSPAQYAQDSDYPWNAASSPAYMTPRTKKTSLSGLRRLSSQAYGLSTLAGSLPNSPSTPTASLANFNFTQATPPYADGSWEMYSDFVGGLQLWSYALASGSADGCVRMWDTRTGQSVRSLIGHTSAVTCLQFDNLHLVSGSIDKTVRVWDLRTGRTIETLRYDGPVTSLQFDSRRIMVAGGTNNVQVFNRTTLQQTELVINGHTSPVERLRFMDRYLATGARDSTVKIWSLS